MFKKPVVLDDAVEDGVISLVAIVGLGVFLEVIVEVLDQRLVVPREQVGDGLVVAAGAAIEAIKTIDQTQDPKASRFLKLMFTVLQGEKTLSGTALSKTLSLEIRAAGAKSSTTRREGCAEAPGPPGDRGLRLSGPTVVSPSEAIVSPRASL